jgi:hypothetical protein
MLFNRHARLSEIGRLGSWEIAILPILTQYLIDLSIKFLDTNNAFGYNRLILDKVLMAPKGIKTDNLKPLIEDFY